MTHLETLTEEYNRNRQRYDTSTQEVINKLIKYCKRAEADVSDLNDLATLIHHPPLGNIEALTNIGDWRPLKNPWFSQKLNEDVQRFHNPKN